MSARILIAGIGNIFLGDDAFGVEVAQRLLQRTFPEGVRVVDYGIRSFDLAYALLEDLDATIMVDAAPRGGKPGTLYLIVAELEEMGDAHDQAFEGHSMNPVRVLQLVKTLGGQPKRLLVVGCEPAVLESEDGYIGLSPAVQAAVEDAIGMVESLVETILREHTAGRVHRQEQQG
jgi:hydrogenase maturation protease